MLALTGQRDVSKDGDKVKIVFERLNDLEIRAFYMNQFFDRHILRSVVEIDRKAVVDS